jgi:acyl-CoA thioesterase-1
MMRTLGMLVLLATVPACTSGSEPDAPAPPANSADATAPAAEDEQDDEAITIVYLGDSLTAGYGLPQGEEQAYPALIARRADSLGIAVETVNAGVSGDTSAGGLRRFDWIANRQDLDVLVLALGANDGLRGLPVDALRQNLDAIIEQARGANPDVRVVLAGMMVPTNMGGAYGERFAKVYRDIAAEKDVALIPFLLDGVGGVRALNQPDGVHPTAEGQRVMAETVWETLGPVLDEARASRS